MAAVARMEYNGVPIDVPTLTLLQQNWTNIQDELIASIDAGYGVFDHRTFKVDRWARWLVNNDIAWPRLESGRLDMSDDTFRQMARSNPLVSPIRELRSSLSEMRLADLAVGQDGRNRTLLSPFRARSGRNQPSNSKFIFGPSVWLRGLIKPPPGHGVAYIDWQQQEFGIAAALSGDGNMQAAYRSGDPYLAFAKQADAASSDATKATHKSVREQFKQCVLAVQFGMGEESLAHRIGQPPIQARRLLRLHRETYQTYWNWSDATCDFAMTRGYLATVFGWLVHPCGNRFKSANAAKLSDAGDRSRNAAPRLLSGHGTRHRDLCTST
jgi:DNA polymerase-1